MKLLNLTLGFVLLCATAIGEVLPPRPATQTEVNAGTDAIHPVTSKTLGSWSGRGGGGSATNVPTISAGANISLTPTNKSNGATNYAVAVADPLAVGTLWATNMTTPTNSFAGTLIDFAKGESRTNLGGNLTFTGVANVTAGALNSCVITMAANGADRTIVWPAGFHMSRGSTGVVTNGTVADFLIRLQPGVWTNVSQLDSL